MSRALRATAAAGLLVALAACAASAASVQVTVRLPAEVDPQTVTVGPAWAIRSSTVTDGEVAIDARASAGHVTVRAPGMCPLTLKPSPGAVVEASAWFDLGGDRGQIGYDTPFTIDVALGCAEARRGTVTWKQVDGRRLKDFKVEEGGLRVHARTEPLAALDPVKVDWGIVPISPRTQGRYVFEATWTGDGPTVSRRVTITSFARATGVPSLAVGQRIMLAGQGWHVRQAAPGGHARVETVNGVATFAADITGHWLLEDATGAHLGLREGRFDGTPLGCGTKNCHHQESDALETSPMTQTLERTLGTNDVRKDVSCMLDCHALGERGLHDGGFVDRAEGLRWAADRATTWDELPRTLRRLGSVGCTGCHGPGAIPEPTASRAILRTDVCATCHDAPPRYTHVEQWRRSSMARSDVLPATRATFACARCHMTSQFLADQKMWGIRFADEDDLHAEPAGIGCAACHASHALHDTEGPPPKPNKAMLRAVELPAWLGAEGARRDDATAICLPCHAPSAAEPMPSASAAAIWAGRAPLVGIAPKAGPHSNVGCIACHGGSAPTDHSFRVDLTRCASCHASEVAQRKTPEEHPDANGLRVRERAKALRAMIGFPTLASESAPLMPDHAATGDLAQAVTGETQRAIYELQLVLEDPAAGVHNAPFARALLEDAAAIAMKRRAP